jgi:hypothetical protein
MGVATGTATKAASSLALTVSAAFGLANLNLLPFFSTTPSFTKSFIMSLALK